jgi:hypothetical protein
LTDTTRGKKIYNPPTQNKQKILEPENSLKKKKKGLKKEKKGGCLKQALFSSFKALIIHIKER